MELAVMRHDVGKVVQATGLQVDVVAGFGQVGDGGDVAFGQIETACRCLDPRRDQQGAGPVPGLGGVAGRVKRRQDPLCPPAVAEDDPGPTEPVGDAESEQRVVRGAPGQRGVDVRALGPDEGQGLGLTPAADIRRAGLGCVGARMGSCRRMWWRI
jgi:hypothetical protein